MKFPGLENVFWLSEPFATRPFRGSLREDSSGLDRVEIARGQLVPPQPLRIVPYGGRVPGDFIWTDAGCIILVHERIIDLFSERQFSGWSTYAVEVYDKEVQPIQGFRGFSVTGRCGRIDPRLSTPIQKQMPAGLFPYFKGCLFPPGSWDGSHIFSPKGTTYLLVTSVVLELLQELEAKNVKWTPITEMVYGRTQKRLLEERLAME